jgi:hypothetical protein
VLRSPPPPVWGRVGVGGCPRLQGVSPA